MGKTFMILGVISALALLLIAGCQNQPMPIGGDKDSHGCLIGAGYSWNETIGACVRSWELNENQAKAAQIAVAPISARPVTVIEVIQARCPGCFAVKLQTGEGAPYTIMLENWIVIENKECTDTCPLLSQPSPTFCTDGTIVDGGKDECGCQLPPKCLRACTEEAKICPDGSAVGRNSENNCEFDPCPTAQLPNPAAKFCIDNSGSYKIITSSDGSQSGICKLAGGIICDEWAYFRGECPEKVVCTAEQKAAEMCTMEYAPVCGDDGATYGNKCSACASKKIDSYVLGECPEKTDGKLKATECTEPRPQACTKEYIPVCGWFDDTIHCIRYPCAATYGNKCTACADENVAYWTEGQCPE